MANASLFSFFTEFSYKHTNLVNKRGVLARILCIRLVDLKIISTYSSVSHIGCVLIPVILRRKFSTAGGMILIIAHAVSSSAMFLISYNLYQKNFLEVCY